MMEIEVFLKPLQYSSHAIEQILMIDDQLDPVALFHIDLLWDSHNHEIHDKLSSGQTVQCELRFSEVKR